MAVAVDCIGLDMIVLCIHEKNIVAVTSTVLPVAPVQLRLTIRRRCRLEPLAVNVMVVVSQLALKLV
jgi:hypothetical protein